MVSSYSRPNVPTEFVHSGVRDGGTEGRGHLRAWKHEVAPQVSALSRRGPGQNPFLGRAITFSKSLCLSHLHVHLPLPPEALLPWRSLMTVVSEPSLEPKLGHAVHLA